MAVHAVVTPSHAMRRGVDVHFLPCAVELENGQEEVAAEVSKYFLVHANAEEGANAAANAAADDPAEKPQEGGDERQHDEQEQEQEREEQEEEPNDAEGSGATRTSLAEGGIAPPRPAETEKTAHLRGRLLRGRCLALDSVGAEGQVWQKLPTQRISDNEEERNAVAWSVLGVCNEVHIWDHDAMPRQDHNVQQAVDWMEIAQAMAQPVS